MSLVQELLVTIGLSLYYLVENIVLFFVPFSWRRKDVTGQKVLITGSGSGIGRLMSYEFAKLGCTLVLVDVNKSANEETAESVRQLDVSAHTYCCDLSQREDVYKVMEQIKRDVGDIDILVNNAGIVSGLKIMQCPDALMEKTMQVNTMAHFWTVKSVLPSMLARNKGHVVTIASLAGVFGVNGLVDYCSSKFAAIGFDESLRIELSSLGKTGVHTTLICPYYINTGMFDGIYTRFPSLLPILDPDYVVSRIMDGVLCNQEIVYLPRITYILAPLKHIMPVKVTTILGNFIGINCAMDSFRGRSKQE